MTSAVPITDPEIKFTQIFINNEFVNSVSGKTFPTVNPTTEEEICQVQEGDKADVDKAVAAAKAAFKRGSPWRTMDASQRGNLLRKLADLAERDIAYIGSLETLDNGKPFSSACNDVKYACNVLRNAAAWSDRVCGETIPADGSVFTYTRYEPFGVVGVITPWNFPFMIAAMSAYALAVGNVLVVKPAEQTPLTTIYLGKLAQEAGFPPGVFNVVPGYGPTAGHAISSHPDIRMVAFTGSTVVGRKVMTAAAESNLKKVSLELGGKSPNVIFPDVNIDEAVAYASEAIMFNMGQCCIAGSRTFVHEDIYDEFVRKCVEYVKKTKIVGDPFKSGINQGPLVNSVQFEKVLGYMKAGPAEGAKLQCGGARHGTKGYFIQPTIFSDVTNDMSIAREEIFGPVQCILKFKTMDEVIEMANDTSYGLAAAVFTKDLNTAITVANSLEAGTVWVNQYFGGTSGAPFGGYKQSGIGRQGGKVGVEEYCEIKTVSIKLPVKNS
ncbi:aldehyde dehydrogenase-like [Lineus longissimus]|uniref:aldehyde dehydrogenase-like n=1 Tax=Lineus longissimus TaxID=88925 RepID=UPI002B4C2525